jgi:hypothetical protein
MPKGEKQQIVVPVRKNMAADREHFSQFAVKTH